MHTKIIFAALSLCLLATSPVKAATLTYADRSSFLSALSTSITDDYEDAGYAPAFMSDAVMSNVLGETTYEATGHTTFDINMVSGPLGNQHYCAGCNGSFLLNFQSTSVGTSDGVFGVAFDFFNPKPDYLYTAFVTFGDDTTLNIDLPHSSLFADPPGFFSISSDLLIKSIHLGLPDGGTTTTIDGNFGIYDLTIGAVGTVPVPAALPLFGTGLAIMGFMGWRRKRKAA